MKKKAFIILTCILLVAAVLCGCSGNTKVEAGEELLSNGDFETANSFTKGWTTIYDTTSSVTPTAGATAHQGSDDYGSTTEVNGKQTVFLKTSSSTYCYLTQPVQLEQKCYYKLSAQVSITSKLTLAGSLGAYVGLAENTAVYASQSDSTAGFVTLTTYFYNDNYDEVNVRFGIGNENSKVSGSVYFDNVSIQKIDAIPTDTVVLSVKNSNVSGYYSGTADLVYVILTVVLTAIALYAAFIVIRRKMRTPTEIAELGKTGVEPTNKGFTVTTIAMLAVLLVGFGIRLILINLVYGDLVTINQFGLMSTRLANLGPIQYYLQYCAESAPQAAPGMMYVLWIFGLIAKPLGLASGSQGLSIFLKIPAIIADLVAVFVIFNITAGEKKYTTAQAVAFAGSYAILPVVFSASSIWCTAYSIGTLFLLLTFVAVLNKKYIMMTVWYFLAVMFVAETLVLLPLLIAFCVYMYIKDERSRNVLPICAVAAFIGGYLITLPFGLEFFKLGKPFIVLTNYCKMFTTSAMFTDGAYNVYGLFNLAGQTANTAGVVCSAIIVAFVLIASLIAYIKCRNRLDLLLIGATSLILCYTLSIRMSVWFMFPALLLLLAYAIYANEGRVLCCYFGFGLLGTVNTAYYLYVNGFITGGLEVSEAVTVLGTDPVLIVFSILSVLLAGYLTYVTVTIVNGKKCDIPSIKVNYFQYVKSLFVKKPEITEEDNTQQAK